jgi:hypothetical protein
VLVVSAVAPSVKEAVDLAYAGVNKISFEGVTFRKDIAHRFVNSPFTLSISHLLINSYAVYLSELFNLR